MNPDEPQAAPVAAPEPVQPSAPSAEPAALNGIKATSFHDEGAIAQCSCCGRYTLDPESLSPTGRELLICECGEGLGGFGSFKRPGPDAKWHGRAPTAPTPAQAAPVAVPEPSAPSVEPFSAAELVLMNESQIGRLYGQIHRATPQAAPAPAGTISIQEAWELAGGNPGIRATRADLETALRELDKVCDEAAQAAPVAAQTEPQQPSAPSAEPIGYMSAKQIPAIRDPEDESGHYIPIRKTPAGNFTPALYTAPPALAAPPQPQPLTAEQVNAISRAEHGGGNPQEWFCNAIRATESACAAAWGITLDAAPQPAHPAQGEVMP